MKLLTIFGTRPEIIRLSLIIGQLDRFCDQVLVHTGQNFDAALSDVFFAELGLRPPDRHLAVRGDSFADQAGQILSRCGEVMAAERPDAVLVLGDTNSGLAAIVAARHGIPVFHLEAGNRCYDDRVPEELNRRLIDHSSTVLLPYTERSKENLVREGIDRHRIFVVGNPILEVLDAHRAAIDASSIRTDMGLEAGRFVLATMHRAENVDRPERLAQLVEVMDRIDRDLGMPVVVSLHPRTADRMARLGLESRSDNVRLCPPLGFFDFVSLERQAFCVVSDSGTVQEECCIFGVPNVTVRDVTERPETIECGSNILSGTDPDAVLRAVSIATSSPTDWTPPPEYLERRVSRAVVKIVLGHRPATTG